MWFMPCGAARLLLLVRTGTILDALRLRAQSIQLVAVPHHLKAAQPARDVVLQLLEIVVVKLDDESALLADHVVVMLGLTGHFVAGLAVAKLARRGQAAVR